MLATATSPSAPQYATSEVPGSGPGRAPGAPGDAVVAGRAGGGDGVVGPHEAQVHRQQRAAHVGDRERDAEGIHLAVALAPLQICSDTFLIYIYSSSATKHTREVVVHT